MSRAQTLLRGATIRRDSDAISGDVTARNFGPVISDLHREKTSLESRLFPDANLKEVGAFFDAQRKPKRRVVVDESQDSDFDTDLEDELSENAETNFQA